MDARPMVLRSWWMLALRGVLLLLFGGLALSMPGPTVLSLVAIFAVYALLAGLVYLTGAARNRRHATGSHAFDWWLLLVLGAGEHRRRRAGRHAAGAGGTGAGARHRRQCDDQRRAGYHPGGALTQSSARRRLAAAGWRPGVRHVRHRAGDHAEHGRAGAGLAGRRVRHRGGRAVPGAGLPCLRAAARQGGQGCQCRAARGRTAHGAGGPALTRRLSRS